MPGSGSSQLAVPLMLTRRSQHPVPASGSSQLAVPLKERSQQPVPGGDLWGQVVAGVCPCLNTNSKKTASLYVIWSLRLLDIVLFLVLVIFGSCSIGIG